jgi:hypothetical protein
VSAGKASSIGKRTALGVFLAKTISGKMSESGFPPIAFLDW